jgi:hypothetical protein
VCSAVQALSLNWCTNRPVVYILDLISMMQFSSGLELCSDLRSR